MANKLADLIETLDIETICSQQNENRDVKNDLVCAMIETIQIKRRRYKENPFELPSAEPC